jgi:hypothetical protein
MDKITGYQKCIKDITHIVSRGQLINDRDIAGPKEWFQDVINVGGVFGNGTGDAYIHPWWDSLNKRFSITWYSTKGTESIKLFEKLFTTDRAEKCKQHGWEIQLPLILESTDHPGIKKKKLLSIINKFDNQSTNKIVTEDGTYIKNYDGITLHSADGTVSCLTNSNEDQWLWSFMIQKHSHISQEFAIQDWCDNVDHDQYNFYHEMHHPNYKIGRSFQTELKNNEIILDDSYIKEFIDQVHLLFPHMKKMRPDYVRWPTRVITFDHRFKNDNGYYFMFYTNWGISAEQWLDQQLDYLNNFLDNQEYTGNKDAIIEYARQQWTIL